MATMESIRQAAREVLESTEGCQNRGPGGEKCAGGVIHSGPCCCLNAHLAWHNPNARPNGLLVEDGTNAILKGLGVGASLEIIQELLRKAATSRWLVPTDKAPPAIFEYKATPIQELLRKAATSRWLTPPVAVQAITDGDRRGYFDRAKARTDETCRLGCACSVHKPTKATPWVPSVDDFDLLPEAAPCPT